MTHFVLEIFLLEFDEFELFLEGFHFLVEIVVAVAVGKKGAVVRGGSIDVHIGQLCHW